MRQHVSFCGEQAERPIQILVGSAKRGKEKGEEKKSKEEENSQQ